MFLSEWREFPSAPCRAEKKNLMTARVSMLLKSRASLIFFRACFLPGRAKDLSAPLHISAIYTSPANHLVIFDVFTLTMLCEHDLRATFKAGNFLASLASTVLPKKTLIHEFSSLLCSPLLFHLPYFQIFSRGWLPIKEQGKALSLNSAAAELFWNPCPFND